MREWTTSSRSSSVFNAVHCRAFLEQLPKVSVVIWEQLFLRKETAMSGFVDFAEVKERCSIVDAVALLGLKTTEERNQLRAACPACGNGGPRAIVITPSKGLFHCFPSKAGGDQIALVSHVKGVSQKNAAALMLGQPHTVFPPFLKFFVKRDRSRQALHISQSLDASAIVFHRVSFYFYAVGFC
jgi:hypothetical protein